MSEVARTTVAGNAMAFDRRRLSVGSVLRCQQHPDDLGAALATLTETVDDDSRGLLAGILPLLSMEELGEVLTDISRQWATDVAPSPVSTPTRPLLSRRVIHGGAALAALWGMVSQLLGVPWPLAVALVPVVAVVSFSAFSAMRPR